uniref:MOB kinase activator-like 2 n=1 Tax=Timema poppense TaxID=170557 RepID=A0A7R9CZA2_TIMPO|nr:unnamed protein product [Timema poppensis]
MDPEFYWGNPGNSQGSSFQLNNNGKETGRTGETCDCRSLFLETRRVGLGLVRVIYIMMEIGGCSAAPLYHRGDEYSRRVRSYFAIAFFDHINLVYGTISEFCTMSGCPDMTGPGLRTYLWFDDKGKKTRVAAPQYIDYVMTFTQKTISDESIFPTKYANEFPSSFESIVRKILRLLFHVLAHLYHCHFREVVLLNLHAHLNCVFAHLTLFNHRFQLIDLKETEILQDLVVALKVLSDDTETSQQAAEYDKSHSESLSAFEGGGGTSSHSCAKDTETETNKAVCSDVNEVGDVEERIHLKADLILDKDKDVKCVDESSTARSCTEQIVH